MLRWSRVEAYENTVDMMMTFKVLFDDYCTGEERQLFIPGGMNGPDGIYPLCSRIS